MKTRATIDPNDFRCPDKNPNPKVNWCYKVVKGILKRGFVVQINVHGRLIVGHLSKGCTRVTGPGSERKAKVFASAKVADEAAQQCILMGRKQRKN